ncbi:hypothetical protein H0H92_003215 [Tricholoma furcatifolium]|nr:hypothetical protein H0H92_003215 [Tricholoma furcatifolium]
MADDVNQFLTDPKKTDLVIAYEANMKLAGIIYLYDISHNRWEASSGRNLHLFEKLCGQAAAKKVVFATTMWDKVTQEKAVRREQQLQGDMWREMIERGSTMHRVETSDAARAIIDFLVEKNDCHPIKIQREMVDGNKLVAETRAGRVMGESGGDSGL